MSPPIARPILSALARWHRRHARDLPWRGERDPYRVWLREVMLQQTTVAAVIPYLERFLTQFPTVQALAAAEETDVLRLWEGLGYYSRARNLHRAARTIVRDHAGEFPRDLATLQSLPGIGRYTAGAIASFAFHEPAAIVEANTLRLHTRLLGYDGDPRSTDGQRRLWTWAEELVTATTNRGTPSNPPLAGEAKTSLASPQKRGGGRVLRLSPADVNQALMDLGATVCTPAAPNCSDCPLCRWCIAFQQGAQHELPRLPKRPPLTRVTEATVAIRHRGRYLLRRRSEGERWAGLWDFPRFAVSHGQSAPGVLIDGVRDQAGLEIEPGEQLAEFSHGVTRYRITLQCFTATVRGGRLHAGDHLAWAPPSEFARYPLSVTGRKLARLLSHQPRASGRGSEVKRRKD